MKILAHSRSFIALLLSLGLIISTASCGRENESTTDTSAGSTAKTATNEAHTTKTTAVNNAQANTLDETLAHGESAHKNHCYKCHTDEVYTRENRFVKSIDALSEQVVRCKNGSNIPWFDEDAEAVVQFLNQKYYKF